MPPLSAYPTLVPCFKTNAAGPSPELNPRTTQTTRNAMALVPVPLASDNAIPQESLEMTSDDFATKQDVTTGMDQQRVNIANSSAGTDEVRSISSADLNSKGKERKSDTPPTSPISCLIKHCQAMIPTRGVSAQGISSQPSPQVTDINPTRQSSYGDKAHEEKKTSPMTRGHDPAATLFDETRSKVKLDTLDKLTREMRRLRNLAHKTGAAKTNG